MEEKKFFETFPTLHLNKRIEQIFSEAIVTHICMNGQRTCVKIYVRFQRLIGRDIIADVDQAFIHLKQFLMNTGTVFSMNSVRTV